MYLFTGRIRTRDCCKNHEKSNDLLDGKDQVEGCLNDIWTLKSKQVENKISVSHLSRFKIRFGYCCNLADVEIKPNPSKESISMICLALPHNLINNKDIIVKQNIKPEPIA
ncbi:hypothetical protein B5X24_HaOG212454 [Helicoverpa armigera]|nr:hypothetical protein B5X24_HaOG212454 [Helicoverpa armigera]